MHLLFLTQLALASSLPPWELVLSECKEGQQESCLEIALRFRDGKKAPIDIRHAHRILEQSCNEDYGPACREWARAHRTGDGMKLQPFVAIDLYMKACKLSDGIACRELGDMYTIGEGMPLDPMSAFLWYDLACSHNDGFGCYEVGLHHEIGYGMGQTDLKQAHYYYKRSCQLRYGHGCTAHGSLFERGLGTEKSLKSAMELYDEGCGIQDGRGCSAYARALLKTSKKNTNLAYLYFEKSCDKGDPSGCREYGIYLEKHEPERALSVFLRGCENGDTLSCKRVRKAQ